jgi:hypothetical protein
MREQGGSKDCTKRKEVRNFKDALQVFFEKIIALSDWI